jgi:hypothetical protein
MDTLFHFFSDITLSDIGSIASIIGLIFTILVLIDVRRLKSYYLFTARMPELARKLREHTLNIAEYLSDFEKSIQDISVELARLEVVLNSLSRKLDRTSSETVVQLLKYLKNYDVERAGKTGLRKIHVYVNKILDEIEDLQEDLKWKR